MWESGAMRTALTLVFAGAASGDSCQQLVGHGGGSFYTTELGVGTPRQALNVIPDTGSYDLLLDSTFCSRNGCQLHRQFNPQASSSFIKKPGRLTAA